MERTKTLTITITIDKNEEMFTVETLEPESGCTTEFGPTPIWSDWRNTLKDKVGNEVISWIDLMMDEDGE